MSCINLHMVLLCSFANAIPDELKEQERVDSFFITSSEAKLLNEINYNISCSAYGPERFGTNDVVIPFEQFKRFYELMSDTVMSNAVLHYGLKWGGWIQVNNTVSCYTGS